MVRRGRLIEFEDTELELLEELVDAYDPQGVILGLAEVCDGIAQDLEEAGDHTRAQGWGELATYLGEKVAYARAVVRAS